MPSIATREEEPKWPSIHRRRLRPSRSWWSIRRGCRPWAVTPRSAPCRSGRRNLKQTPRLDQALENAPGVSLFRRTTSLSANPTTQGVSLRSIAGSGAGRALVTLDGAPVNDPFGGWVIWTALPSEGLDGATIVRGAGAGPYGAGALTGVIALQERGARDGLGAADVSVGERGAYRAAVSGGTQSVLVTVSGESNDGYTPVRGKTAGAADTPLDLEDANAAVRVQHDFNGVQVAARAEVFEERRGAGLEGARSRASGTAETLTLAQPATEGVGGWRLQAWTRTSDLANTSVAVAPDRSTTTPANNEFSTPATGYGVNAALQGHLGVATWEFGADARWALGTDHELFKVVNGAYTMGRDAGGQTFVGGIYLETAYDQGPWLITGGARIDEWNSTDARRHEFVLATGVTTLNNPSPDASGTVPTGRIGVRYTVDPDLWVRTAAYAGFRAPTLNELYRPFRVGNDVTEANPSLSPEKLYGIEAGLGGDASVQVASDGLLQRAGRPGDQCDHRRRAGHHRGAADRRLHRRRRHAPPAPERRRDRRLGRGGRRQRRPDPGALLAHGARLYPRPRRRRVERAATHRAQAGPDAGLDGDRRA